MKAWNMYMAHSISLNPSCAPYLIAYQCIITSASNNHHLQAWINYNVKFCNKTASESSLRWDIWDLDLWLEHFPDTAAQPNSWPCNHCGTILTVVLFVALIHILMEEENYLTKEAHQLMEVDQQLMEEDRQPTEMDHQHPQTHSNDLPQHMPRL